MSQGASNLCNTLKKMMFDSINFQSFSDWSFGVVVQTNPLKILKDQKITLPSNVLDVSPKLSNYQLTVEYENDNSEVVEKVITVKNELNPEDKVLLLKKQDGQRYYVLEKITETEAVREFAQYRS